MPKVNARRSASKSFFDRTRVYDPSRPMNVEQVADFLGYTTRTIYELVSKGVIPATKHQGKLFFSPRKVYEYAGMMDYLPTEIELI